MTPKLSKLYQLFNSVVSDFGLELIPDGAEEAPEAELYEYQFRVGEGRLAPHLSLTEEEGQASANFIIDLQGQDWDFPDLLELDFDEFHMEVEKMDSQLREPYTKDYGLDFLNIVGWLLHASQNLPQRDAAKESFAAGAYQVRVRAMVDGEERVANPWVRASSSEDAIETAKEQIPGFISGEVINFKEEPGDWE